MTQPFKVTFTQDSFSVEGVPDIDQLTKQWEAFVARYGFPVAEEFLKAADAGQFLKEVYEINKSATMRAPGMTEWIKKMEEYFKA